MKEKWTKCNGMLWQVNPPQDPMPCQDAMDYAASIGARLPTINELFPMFNRMTGKPLVIPELKWQSNFYWSSTTYAPLTSYAWVVSFLDGYMFNGGKSNMSYVRCVKDITI